MADAKVEVNPPFTEVYGVMIRLCGEAIAAAAKDDVDTLHKINHQLLSHSVNMAQFSFFGLTVQRINDQRKQQEQEPELPLDNS